MKKTLLGAIVILLVAFASPGMADGPYPQIISNFDLDTVGNTPIGWDITRETSPPTARGCRVVDVNDELGSDPYSMFQMLKLHDDNVTGSATTKFYSIKATRSFGINTTGVVTLTCDLYFKQISALFMVRFEGHIVDGTLANAAQILFEGNQGWRATNAGGSYYVEGTTGPGHISYHKTQWTPGSVVEDTGYTYAADTWYTLKIVADCDARRFTAYFGAKGSTLTKIVDNQPFPYQTGGYVGQSCCLDVRDVAFLTSNCVDEREGYDAETDETVYVDNVLVTGPIPPPTTDTIAQARLLDKAVSVNMTDQIVTAGTDQVDGISGWVNGWFYIQDPFAGGPGIRVRWPSATIHEGDKVNLGGLIEQASEGGYTKHNGEREIIATYVTVTSSDNTVPAPIAMRNSEVGGGWYGPLESPDANGDEPRLKGVWPMNTTPDPYYYNDPAANSFSPLFNVGTLVTVCGKITDFCDQYEGAAACPDIYIYDGSLEFDGCNATDYPPQGMRIRMSQSVWDAVVAANSSTTLNVGDYVSVTGIAGAIGSSNLGGTSTRNIRLVRIRKASDFVLVNDVEPPW